MNAKLFFFFLITLSQFAVASPSSLYVVISVHTELFNESKLVDLGWDIVPSADSCHNIHLLPDTILRVLEKHNVPATWYIEEDWWYGDSWSSASNCSHEVLGLLSDNGEIGLHVHYASSLSERNALSEEEIRRKIEPGYFRLSSLNHTPLSFVAGNYLLSERTIPVLESLNFTSDLSVNPGMLKAGYSKSTPNFPYHSSYSDLNSVGNSSLLFIPNIGLDISESRRDFLDTFKQFVMVNKLNSYLASSRRDIEVVTLVIHSWDCLSSEDLDNLDFMITKLYERNATFITASEAASIWESRYGCDNEAEFWRHQRSLRGKIAYFLARVSTSFISLF